MVINSSVTSSVLNEIYNAILYHRVRESQSDVTLMVGCIPGEYNLADLSTKILMPGNMRHRVVELII